MKDTRLNNRSSPHFVWPVIDEEIRDAVNAQLNDTVSIYDNGGIFGRFEKKFQEFSGLNHCLLFNSGTEALHAAYFALNLERGSEIISSAYTFHASTSPAVSLGLKVKFCDTDVWGNMSIESLKEQFSDNTRAVVVTHMWGNPAKDIVEIARFCKENNASLIEDCSHAHGAKIYNNNVGTFGDIAAWSIQGQKNITAGEGGVMGTQDSDLYYRALLFGHYNKRPKNEIPKTHPLYKYYLTGYGLKLRAHPLGIAIANSILERYNMFLANKDANASLFDSVLGNFDFITTPPRNGKNSWYAYAFQFDSSKSAGTTRGEFVSALHNLGLSEVDIPGSTGLINSQPLFSEPRELHLSSVNGDLSRTDNFTNAKKFSEQVIKLPVWAHESDSEIVEMYCDGLSKICKDISDH